MPGDFQLPAKGDVLVELYNQFNEDQQEMTYATVTILHNGWVRCVRRPEDMETEAAAEGEAEVDYYPPSTVGGVYTIEDENVVPLSQ
ncbi:hypothetical protein [Halomarina pelagica]|uniref:hypothetical protein n=1 Tax=Halomarina pelagica TaxID=2961599 RepID=UPI0020C1C07A|nr:hypothetical protein [Halomarina sp. BND7]